MERWRALMSHLAGRGAARAIKTERDAPTPSPFDRPSDLPAQAAEPLDLALDEIEAGALEVYAKAGLPTAVGHYRKPPQTDAWTFIGDRIPPETRFALALEHPAEMGWRFARLQDLGARSDRPELRAAARLLSEIAELRAARRGVLTEDHLLMAMELGGAWRALRDSKAVRTSRLTLTPPKPAARPPAKTPRKPRVKRDKTAKPR
jgi:hypothetical protein